jgi:arylformamidase
VGGANVKTGNLDMDVRDFRTGHYPGNANCQPVVWINGESHVDASTHFIGNGRTIDTILLDELIGDVTILDFSNLKESESINSEMLKKMTFGDKVIFNFNWAKNFNTSKFYQNIPYVSYDAAEYLLSKNVRLIGMDTPSPDGESAEPGSDEDSKIHKLLLKNNVILVESLNNLDKLNDFSNWKLFAIPLKIKNGDASPARVFLYK